MLGVLFQEVSAGTELSHWQTWRQTQEENVPMLFFLYIYLEDLGKARGCFTNTMIIHKLTFTFINIDTLCVYLVINLS